MHSVICRMDMALTIGHTVADCTKAVLPPPQQESVLPKLLHEQTIPFGIVGH